MEKIRPVSFSIRERYQIVAGLKWLRELRFFLGFGWEASTSPHKDDQGQKAPTTNVCEGSSEPSPDPTACEREMEYLHLFSILFLIKASSGKAWGW